MITARPETQKWTFLYLTFILSIISNRYRTSIKMLLLFPLKKQLQRESEYQTPEYPIPTNTRFLQKPDFLWLICICWATYARILNTGGNVKMQKTGNFLGKRRFWRWKNFYLDKIVRFHGVFFVFSVLTLLPGQFKYPTDLFDPNTRFVLFSDPLCIDYLLIIT